MSKANDVKVKPVVGQPVRINNMAWEPCPNPECDPEGGCCLCDHTGKILTYVLDKMQVKQADASQKG